MKGKFARALAALVGLAIAPAWAAWPDKPIKVIVPFQPGGTSDQTARAFQGAIQENNLLPQPITIINVGGHYSIGARRVMESPPDGYTFLILHIALMGGEGTGALDFGYRDFEPVASTAEFCVLPMVRKDSGINSLKELLEKAKAQPDTLIFGANIGAINHMAGIMLQDSLPGAQFRFVQIGGGTANFTALTGSQTNTTVLSGAEVMNFAMKPDGTPNPESQIKPLAYTGPKRHPRLASIPTAKEEGYDVEFCVRSWWFAPKGTPAEAVNGFAEALEKASGTTQIAKFNDSQLFTPYFTRGDALRKELDETWKRILPIAQKAKKK